VVRQITINPLPVLRLTLKQLGIVVRLYSIIQDRAELSSVIKVVKDKKDNLAELANNVIEAKNRNVVEPTEKACLCLPSLAKETFMLNKDNKSKVKFV
jgi:hypothetical protein